MTSLNPFDFSKFDLVNHQGFPRMARPGNPGHEFFKKCLEDRNAHAIYLQSIRQAFCLSQLDEALENLREIKDDLPIASLLYLLLGYCAGLEDGETYIYLWSEFDFAEIEKWGSDIESHVKAMGPKRKNTYASTFFCDDYRVCIHPDKWHCKECFFYLLGLQICALS